MNSAQHGRIVAFIWGIADDVLRDLYVRGKYRDVILPFTVLRRSEAANIAITRARREIGLLEEFRTRLTADVVTGQVDVRDIAARLPDIDPAELAGDVTGGSHDDLSDEAAEYLEDVTA